MTRIYAVTIAEHIVVAPTKKGGQVTDPGVDTWRTASHSVAVVDGWVEDAIVKALALRNAAENADKVTERHAVNVQLTHEAE